MKEIPSDIKRRLLVRRLIKQARAKMEDGYAYGMDDLFDVDKLSDDVCMELMNVLDNHQLVRIDRDFPKRWTRK